MSDENKPLTDDEKKAIKTAAELLEHKDDTHWTKAGLPDLTAVSELVGSKVTRNDMEAVLPDFQRTITKGYTIVSNIKEGKKFFKSGEVYDGKFADDLLASGAIE